MGGLEEEVGFGRDDALVDQEDGKVGREESRLGPKSRSQDWLCHKSHLQAGRSKARV